MYKDINITSIDKQITRNIRAEMVRSGVTNLEIADATGKSPTLVSMNLRGTANTRDIREEICKRLGKSEAELWADPPAPEQDEKRQAV